MKNILALILLMSIFTTMKAQDFIYMKDGGKFDVKILKVDKSNVLFYLNSDSTKQVRKVSLSVISKHEYNSRNNPIFHIPDSILLANYDKQIETNILNPDLNNEESITIAKEYKLDQLIATNPAVSHFTKARNQFAIALVSMASAMNFSGLPVSSHHLRTIFSNISPLCIKALQILHAFCTNLVV